MKMTQTQAFKIAIESMKREMKTIAVDANLYELFGVDNPSAVNAYHRREKLREAIKLLSGKPDPDSPRLLQ